VIAGTLGGISLLEGDQIRANYTTATSALKHNWITAALWDGGEWWVGTYGAGVARMNNAGKFEAGSGASGNLVINPNAMLATERVLLAGTMGHGLYVMNRTTGRWTGVTEGLPSLNVTALAASQAQVSSAFGSANLGHSGINSGSSGYIYVGTDNGLVRIPEQRLER
jgi:ligand-binding sensor domain-containing protein